MRTTSAAAAVILILMFLPLLYVLSLGPAVWLHDRGLLSPGAKDALEVFYFPLEWSASRTPLVERPLAWYIGLWERTIPVRVGAPVSAPPVPPPSAAPLPLPQPAPNDIPTVEQPAAHCGEWKAA